MGGFLSNLKKKKKIVKVCLMFIDFSGKILALEVFFFKGLSDGGGKK